MQQNIIYVIQRSITQTVCEYHLREHMLLGRNKKEERPAIKVACPIMSRKHGEFLLVGGQVLYRDLGSSNGTCINDVHYGFAGEEKEKILNDGDVLRIDTADSPAIHPDAVILVYRNNARDILQWQAVDLTQAPPVIHIGRDVQKSDICINDSRISRNHASFVSLYGGWAVEDHDSTNGVCVNNRRIRGIKGLEDLDCVRIQDYLFVYFKNTLLVGMTSDLRISLSISDDI